MSSGMRIVAILTVVVASLLAVTWATSAQAPKPAERPKWEYKVFSSRGGAEDLKTAGNDGWELVAVVQEAQDSRLAYLKRPQSN